MTRDEEGATVQGRITSVLSVRVIVESLAVAAILWLASTVNESNLAMARMQVQITQIQGTLADVPGLTREIIQVQASQSEHDRRISVLEADVVSHDLRATGAMH